MATGSVMPGAGAGGGLPRWGGTGLGNESINAAMRLRVASFGRRPTPPAISSSMWIVLLVPMRATVIAGWLITYFAKNCAQVFASNSAAHAGTAVVPTRAKRFPPLLQLAPKLL